MAALGDEQSNSAVAGKPLETSGVGLTEGLKQSLNIAPTIRTQHALELKSLHLVNTLIAISWSQVQAAATDLFDRQFILEGDILPVTSDQ